MPTIPTIQISKIQLRRGVESDLPGAPASLAPLVFTAGLDDGELAFATDSGRLFIGLTSPTNGQTNFQRSEFPYQNTEVLTENSPTQVFQPAISDNRYGFIKSVPLVLTDTYRNLQVLDRKGSPYDFNLDFPISGVNAMIQYYVFGSDQTAMRQGLLNVVWNPTLAIEPVVADNNPVFGVGNWDDLQWMAVYNGSHVVLQYINQTGDTPTVYFRIDRPIIE